MSAKGHEQTSRHVRVMSVISLKADIHQRRFARPLNAITGHSAAARAAQSSRCFVVKPLTLSHSAGVIFLTVTLKVQMWPSGSLAR